MQAPAQVEVPGDDAEFGRRLDEEGLLFGQVEEGRRVGRVGRGEVYEVEDGREDRDVGDRLGNGLPAGDAGTGEEERGDVQDWTEWMR